MPTATTPMPAAFIGHGSPMSALEHNRYTDAWQRFFDGAPRPRAVLAVSAHWYINATAVTAMTAPRTIHDFFGFPPELFAVDYPAPGAPDLCAEIVETVAPVWVGLDVDSWGIDHGTWSVLTHGYADATVPVVQLSVDASKPAAAHFDLGRRLAPLRERGVLIVCSGNVVHNLGALNMALAGEGYDWAQRFATAVRETLVVGDPAELVGLERHPDFAAAAPTPDHWLPALYFAGLAAAAGSQADVLVDGYEMGTLSMASYTLGAGQAG